MKKFLILLTLVLSFMPAFGRADSAQVNAAMQDELKRNMQKLKMANFDKPYFISYSFTDTAFQETMASLGATVKNSTINKTEASSRVRVGDYKFDNTNFNEDYTFFASPAGMDYHSIRAAFWQNTDSAYKKALEQFSKKKAFKQQKHITEVLPDFSKIKIQKIEEEKKTELFDAAYFEELAKELSAIGKDYKELQKFIVSVYYTNKEKYYLNSEGTSYFQNPIDIEIRVSTSIQNKDGFVLQPVLTLSKSALKDLPSREELYFKTEEFARQTFQLYSAKKAQSYIGPVLLKNVEIPDFINNHFIDYIENTRAYWGEETDSSASPLIDSVGLRLTSNFIDIVDDPLAKEFNGQTLAGYYQIDEEGAPAKTIQLVKNGKLENLPTTRSLLKGQKESNGHARSFHRWEYPRAKTSNLFIKPATTVPAEKLKEELLKECAAQQLDFCYILDTGNEIARKVYTKDGSEEIVYGAQYRADGTRPMRDIIAAGNDYKVYSLNEKASIIAPSLLIREIEIEQTQEKPQKAPLVKKP